MILGDALKQLCQSATQELWLVAPFVKVAALQRLLEDAAPDVKVYCVTRWRPEEIVAGVSDIDVWPLLKERGNSQLRLRSDLHAKYYRADGQCLIGSANITATALGWSAQPNLELLLDIPLHHPALLGFEERLLHGSIGVDNDVYKQIQDVLELLVQEKKPIALPGELQASVEETSVQRDAWIPTLRNPEQLYVAYSGNEDRLTSHVYKSAIADLRVLSIPNGLSKTAFKAYVGYALLQMPIVQKVDMFVWQSRRFGEVSAYLKTLSCNVVPGFESKYAWQTLMRWMISFLPKRYTSFQNPHSEIFKRIN